MLRPTRATSVRRRFRSRSARVTRARRRSTRRLALRPWARVPAITPTARMRSSCRVIWRLSWVRQSLPRNHRGWSRAWNCKSTPRTTCRRLPSARREHRARLSWRSSLHATRPPRRSSTGKGRLPRTWWQARSTSTRASVASFPRSQAASTSRPSAAYATNASRSRRKTSG